MDPRTGPVPEPELLDDEPVRLPRLREMAGDVRRGTTSLRHRGWWWALAIVLVVGAVAVGVDAGMRAREGARVAACEDQLRIATGYAERRLGLVSNYLKPTLSPSGRVQQLHLADLMSARAGRVLPRVQHADRVCRNVTVRPWHFSLVRRQGAATAYSAGLLTVVQTVAAQGRIAFRDDATLQRLRNEVGIGGG
jgi:hypothetical protein